MKKTRTEHDALGELEVPADKYWGINTQRAIMNFDISGKTMPEEFVIALAKVKRACAKANMETGEISIEIGSTILQAIDEIIRDGKFLDQFPIDIFQTGSGTQTNMNANEVIANRANEILGHPLGMKHPVHPNDHVNRSQSSNDVIPTAMYVSVLFALEAKLFPVLEDTMLVLDEKVKEFEDVIKIARTHLQDAVPIRMSTEFRVYQEQLVSVFSKLQGLREDITSLPIGGTAVGTGLNASPEFAKLVIQNLSKDTKYPFKEQKVKAADIASHIPIVMVSGLLRTLALACIKMANDIRWMGSGPRAGLGELILPANEPGSSIMPGKINPTQSEALIQVCIQVIANDEAISFAEGFGSILDLNVTKPLMAANILDSIHILSGGIRSFTQRCLKGIEPNHERISDQLERSLMVVTRLTPIIGYDKAAEIAKRAMASGQTIKETIVDMGIKIDGNIDELLDPSKLV